MHMREMFSLLAALVCSFLLATSLFGCSSASTSAGGTSISSPTASASQAAQVDDAASGVPASVSVTESGSYTSKDEVALYIHTYGHLPANYISKTKARAAGWKSSAGNLNEVLPGKSIGGSTYHNDDGALPAAKNRTWTECDIDYAGGYRGEKRIIFSNDGLVYYTGNHYQTFQRIF